VTAVARRRERPRVARLVLFVTRRFLLGVLTLFLVSIVVFGATQALPSDPARAILGGSATPENVAALREQLHLDRPLFQQYTTWLGGLARGDLGDSLANQHPVTDLLGRRVVNSGFLVLFSALLSVPLAIAIGSLTALRRDRLGDHVASIVSLALAALPEFVIGIALVLLFGTSVFHVLPAVSTVDPGRPIWDQLNLLVLPTVTLALTVTPYIARITRGSMIEVLESDYIEMARLKGLREWRVITHHALPNAIVPTIQVIALQLAYLAGGIVVVEFVFGYPGIGAALVDAVANRDLPVVQALTLLIAALYVCLNLVADVATILVSPRLRTSFS
jgi:peptide/nickel transport system permease protein